MSFSEPGATRLGCFTALVVSQLGRDRVYVVDTAATRVQVFDLHGKPLAAFGGFGSEPGQFYGPSGIAVDGSGNVYVADSLEPPRAKVHLGRDLPDPVGKLGQRTGAVQQSRAVSRWTEAATSTWRIRGNHRVQKFTSDGTFLTQWGSGGSGPGQFDWPRGIAVDGSGNVYVADTCNHRVQKFTVGRDLPDPVGKRGQRTGAVRQSQGYRGGREWQRLRGGYREPPRAKVHRRMGPF